MLTTIIFTHWGMDEKRSELAKRSFISLYESLISPCEIIVINNGSSWEDDIFFLDQIKEKKITHYIRNADNLYFGYARNQGIQLAEGEFVVIVDNDLGYQKGWLEKCLKVFKEHPKEKVIVSPLDYPTPVMRERYHVGFLGKYQLSLRAGSNCFVIRKKTFEEVGLFKSHIIAGSKFTDRLVKAGYLTTVVGGSLVKDEGLRKGYNFRKRGVRIIKTLSDKSELNLKDI